MRIFVLFFMMISGLIACKNEPSVKIPDTKKLDLPVLQEIDVEAAAKLISGNRDGSLVVLDVRTAEEIAEGKLGGAQELDFFSESFEEDLSKLDRTKTYLVYCRSGNRSGQTAEKMVDMGFHRIYNLEGGFTAWLETLPQ